MRMHAARRVFDGRARRAPPAGEVIYVSRPMGKGFQISTIPAEQYPSILLFATGSGSSHRGAAPPLYRRPCVRLRVSAPPPPAAFSGHPSPRNTLARHAGISPIRALIESGALEGRETVRLYYGARTPEHMAFAASIARWSAEHGVTVVPVYSSRAEGYVQDIFANVRMPGRGAGTCEGLCPLRRRLHGWVLEGRCWRHRATASWPRAVVAALLQLV